MPWFEIVFSAIGGFLLGWCAVIATKALVRIADALVGIRNELVRLANSMTYRNLR